MKKIFTAILCIFSISIMFACSLTGREKTVEQAEIYENNSNENKSDVDELSESDIEALKWLIQTLNASHGGAPNTIGNGGVLDTKEKQAEFLYTLNEVEYENILKDSLEKYVVFENDKKLISSENAETVLKMAGAFDTTDVWQYLSKEDSFHMESEDMFALPVYAREGSENFIEFRDWTFIVVEDGKLTVQYKTYSPALHGYIDRVELRLHKNKKSIFGGYSADYMLSVPIEPEGTTFNQDEFCREENWGEYRKPLTMGDSIDDYIFSLDDSLYQMPFPLEELISNGWEYNGNLTEEEKRAEITLTKDGDEIFCICWYCKESRVPKWYVVSIKTGLIRENSNMDFELFSGRKRGDYAYDYREHGIYGFWDPLYGYGFGISVYAEDDKTIQGFNIRYAPKYTNRIKRLNEIATDIKDEVSITENGYTKLERDISYKLTMYEEPIYVQIKSLDKVGWADDMDLIWVKRGEQEEIVEYIEYGMNYTLFIGENKEAAVEVVRIEDSTDNESEVVPIVEIK